MNLSAIFAIARYTLIEQIRNRLYLVIIFFGLIMLASATLVGALAPSHQVRVIFDIGFLGIEMFGLTTAVFGAVTLVLQEIESKTLYLILTRPVRRSTYVLGRYLGLVVAVGVTMLVMGAIHILIMVINRDYFLDFTAEVEFWKVYPITLGMSLTKMMIATAIAVFFSLFATSAVSALVFTTFFWIAGHFGTEISFMIDNVTQGPVQVVAHALAAVLPNFQYLNFRDLYQAPGFSNPEFLGWALIYSVGYAGVFLVVSSFLFSRKEF